jgi:SAM-dependent methyltransferase
VFRAHLEKLADEVAALKPGGRVLEIASNDGTLVNMLKERGVYPMGVDPSGPDGGPCFRASWPWPQLSTSVKQDVILALNVFAHVDDLHSFTAAVKEALAPDGVFIVEVGYLPDVIKHGLFDVCYHEHLSMHHVEPLRHFFVRHGLHLQKAERIDSQGGSVRLYVRHVGKEPVMVSFPAESSPDISHLHERITLTRAGLSLALDGMTTIAGYGCPAKLTTLSYACKIPDLTCVFDDNPLKVGHKTPGSGWPIVPTSELLERNPDALILFSWNFASEIIPRLRAMGYKGRIVTPLPEVEVDEC